MGKRKVGALEKVDADLYVLCTMHLHIRFSLTDNSANLQYKVRRDPLYVHLDGYVVEHFAELYQILQG